MKLIGSLLLLLSLGLFVFGAYSFKTDLDSEQKELTLAVNQEDYALYPDQVQKLYRNHYIFDGTIIAFGAISLIVGGVLVKKSK